MQKLYDAVYADPDNDAPRLALAEALKDDPRAEFIRAQLKKKAKAAPKAHVAQWLEPYGDALVASSVKWERGFPVEARLNLNGKWTKNESGEHPFAKLPALATLRRLKLNSPNLLLHEHHLRRIIQLPALRHLREVDSVRRAHLPWMCAASPPFALEKIRCQQQGGGGLEGEAAEKIEREALSKAIATATGLPKLRHLEMTWNHRNDKPADYAWIWTSEMGRQIEVLRFDGYYFGDIFKAWLPELEAEKSKHLALKRIELIARWKINLERTEQGWRKLTGDGAHEDVLVGRELDTLKKTFGAEAFEIAIDNLNA